MAKVYIVLDEIISLDIVFNFSDSFFLKLAIPCATYAKTWVSFLAYFSQYLVYDTQMVVGGRKHQISPEEHIFGALTLYLDIVYIFISLLDVFGSKN